MNQNHRNFPWGWAGFFCAALLAVFVWHTVDKIFKTAGELSALLHEDANRPNAARVAVNRAFAVVNPDSLVLSAKWDRFVDMENARWKLGQPGIIGKAVSWDDSLLSVTRWEANDRQALLAQACAKQLMAYLAMGYNDRVRQHDAAAWTCQPTALYGRLDRIVSQYPTEMNLTDVYTAYRDAMQKTPEEIGGLERAGKHQEARELATDFLMGVEGEYPILEPGAISPQVVQKIKATGNVE